MSDHLPECLRIEYMVSRHGYTLTASSDRCICAPLRACEQRVREEDLREGFILDHGDPYREIQRKTLLAASMEAYFTRGWFTDEYPDSDGTPKVVVLLEDVVHRIDALREAGSGNPDNPPSAGKPDKTSERRQFTLDEYEDVKRRAYFAGLDAAHKAAESVWTVDPSWDGTNWNNALYEALAAIDALRSEQ